MFLTLIVGFPIANLLLKIKIEQTSWNVQHDQQPGNVRELREAILLFVNLWINKGSKTLLIDGMVPRARRCIQSGSRTRFPVEWTLLVNPFVNKNALF